MKLDELRTLIKKHKREDLEYIIAELYKAIPKAKKEDIDADELISHPQKAVKSKEPKAKAQTRPIKEIEAETLTFIRNAKDGNYGMPNRDVPKNERSKWRFVAKRLFNELTLAAKVSPDQPLAAKLLADLYEMLCYSCDYTIFNAYDSFQSVGISQCDFLKQVFKIYNNCLDRPDFIEKAIRLIINNSINRYTLYSELIETYIDFLTTSDLKYLAIKKASELWPVINKEPVEKPKWGSDISEYGKNRKLNNLTEIIFRCYAHLYEFQNAIENFEKYYIDKNPEVKLYILVDLLFKFEQKDLIVSVLDKAEQNGIKPRKALLGLRDYIKKNNKTPDYI